MINKDVEPVRNPEHTNQNIKPGLLRGEKGFTLIELLVAMFLFNIGFLAILSLQIQALAIIGDSQLKNQALMFASSSHEIYLLTESHPDSANNLSELWAKNIYSYIPDVSFQREHTGNGDFSITLYWPASYGLTACQQSKQVEEDCLRL